MSGHLAWYVARASGIVAWGLVVASIVWGLLYATRVLGRRPAPWWLLGVHRWLGVLAIVFTAVHVSAILLDTYTTFDLVNVIVPFTGSWHPIAVGCGVIGMYLLLAVELTSLAKQHLSQRLWRSIHLASYALFAVSTVHALAAGTDAQSTVAPGLAIALGVMAVSVAALGLTMRSGPRGATLPSA